MTDAKKDKLSSNLLSKKPHLNPLAQYIWDNCDTWAEDLGKKWSKQKNDKYDEYPPD